ncbi:MAG: ParA family protein [Chloroflexi bacterium]|nr:ParA family protein [Chloroflexota bacterium]
MARIIAVVNQKGGVAKTTTVANLGAALAEKGYPTLLVDLDPQGSLGSAFGVEPDENAPTVYHLLIGQVKDVDQVRVRVREKLDLLPANIHLAAAELELAQQPHREKALKRVLDPLRGTYDFILIDCGPSLGLLTINALVAADEVLVPLVTEYLALRGIGALFETIARVRRRLNPRLRILGILPVMHDRRPLHSRQILEEAKALLGDYILPLTVPRSIRFAEAAVAGMPITEYAPRHPGAQVYRQLAEVIIHERKEAHQ